MKAKLVLISAVVGALIALGAFVGCQGAHADGQVAADVQKKINSDQAVQSRQYTVTASNGVVTLAGFVSSDSERTAAAADAAQVEGVKTVVNDLQIASPSTAQQSAAPPEAAQAQPAPEPAAPVREKRHKPGASRQESHPADQGTLAQNTPPPQANPVPTESPAPPPPPPPKPADVTIPEGTILSIRLIDPLDSEHNQTGDRFRATLDSPVVIADTIAIPAGADISGRVTNAKSAAHFSGQSELALELSHITINGKQYDLHTDQYARKGTARGKNTAEKVGGGAVLGAIIGGIAGGGKGAAIGAGVGAGAGGTAQAATHGQQVKLTSEQVLAFHLESPLTVPPPSKNRNEGRQKLDYSE